MKRFNFRSIRTFALTVGLLVPLACGTASAQTIYKADTNTLANTGDFTTSDGGTGTPVPGPNYTGDIGYFDNTISKANENALSLGGNVTIGGLVFASNLNSYVNLTDATYSLSLGASGIDASAANYGVGINSAVVLTSSQTWNVGTGTATYAANSATAYQSSSGLLYVGGNISDGGNAYSITKTGAGILNLGGTNTFSGGVVVDAGTLGIEGQFLRGNRHRHPRCHLGQREFDPGNYRLCQHRAERDFRGGREYRYGDDLPVLGQRHAELGDLPLQ